MRNEKYFFSLLLICCCEIAYWRTVSMREDFLFCQSLVIKLSKTQIEVCSCSRVSAVQLSSPLLSCYSCVMKQQTGLV